MGRRRLTATAAGLLAAATAVAIPCIATATANAAKASPAAAPGSEVTGTLADGATWVADLPETWNGTLLLYSHGFGPLVAQDAPDPSTQAALLARGYALAGSSYDPNGSMWALDSAVRDQFQTLRAVESTVLPGRPHQVLAFGTSMGGMISALEAQRGKGRIDGALTTCGIVAGAVNLNNYQLDGEYAIARLLLPGQSVPLVNLGAGAFATATTLQNAAAAAQLTAAGQARLALAMAYINVPAWDSSQAAPPPATDPAAQEAAQYNVEFTGAFSTIDFIELGRPAIDAADGGQASWTAGVNFAALLERSPYKHEVEALYHAAGLSLKADLKSLSANANITADPKALASLERTSVPTGRLEVPELDLHTISDQLVPVQQENFYAHRVRDAGDGSLLRQAYVASVGHCNFSPAELLAGVLAIGHRVSTGHWGDVASPGRLEAVATGLNLGPARYTAYRPGRLTGAVITPGQRLRTGLTMSRETGTLGRMPYNGTAGREPMLLYQIKQVELAVRSRLDEIFRPAGLTALQYTALTVLERHADMSAAQLARHSFVTAQSMGDMIAALTRRGLIERHRDRADRRRLVVALTAEGHALLDRYRDTVAALEASMLAGLSDPAVASLRHSLHVCHDNLAGNSWLRDEEAIPEETHARA